MDLQEIQTNQIKTAKPIKKEISYDSFGAELVARRKAATGSQMDLMIFLRTKTNWARATVTAISILENDRVLPSQIQLEALEFAFSCRFQHRLLREKKKVGRPWFSKEKLDDSIVFSVSKNKKKEFANFCNDKKLPMSVVTRACIDALMSGKIELFLSEKEEGSK